MMADGPQVVRTDEYPETYEKQNDPSKAMYYYSQTVNEKEESYPEVVSKPEQRTILGLRRRNFWILIGIALVVLAATIGGSVGGALAVKNSSYVMAL